MRTTLAFVLITISYTFSWKLPDLPSGKRSQYFILDNDGGYKYGYDTNENYYAKQAADANNEVAGHYVYKDNTGKGVDVKYTSGIKGFVPEDLNKLLPKSGGPYTPYQSFPYSSVPSSQYFKDDQADTGDASYSFTIDTDTYKRQESSDARGNVQGRYSYTNEAGHHDLNYIAGSKTGFVATSGSLSQPNGLQGGILPSYPTTTHYINSDQYSTVHNIINPDGSYSFAFTTNDQSRQESADAKGNVQGRYVFTNKAGTHDLSYIAGSETGFRATGGSLAIPNGLADATETTQGDNYYTNTARTYDLTDGGTSVTSADQANTEDASYSFSIDTDEYKRQESLDAKGNVKGSYSYINSAGKHDLSFIAGSETGFVPTGGSLSVPNGLTNKQQSSFHDSSTISPRYFQDNKANQDDASYSFIIDTPEYQRQETSDAEGNVKGRYSYQNDAGSHDLRYAAGAETGFVAEGGSLAVPNGISKSLPIAESLVSPLYSPSAKTSGRKVDNVVLKTYYPSKSQSKYGYIYESV